MKRVIWTRQAVEDVEAIKAYVARDSAPYAVLLAERLVAAIEHVGLFPESGRVVPELNDATRVKLFPAATGSPPRIVAATNSPPGSRILRCPSVRSICGSTIASGKHPSWVFNGQDRGSSYR